MHVFHTSPNGVCESQGGYKGQSSGMDTGYEVKKVLPGGEVSVTVYILYKLNRFFSSKLGSTHDMLEISFFTSHRRKLNDLNSGKNVISELGALQFISLAQNHAMFYSQQYIYKTILCSNQLFKYSPPTKHA